jgi:DNA adenine methylase
LLNKASILVGAFLLPYICGIQKTIVMKYLGSKNRIAKHILPIMLEHRKNDMCWVEPFVGGANMIDKVEGWRIGADSNEYVIELLNEMRDADFEAPKINEEKYNQIKNNPKGYPKWMVGYAGTQLSFGSTWFGSYRRDGKGKRDYCLEARKNVNKQSKNLLGATFKKSDYSNLPIPKKSLIYCDPPYNTRATKGKYKDGFNHDAFWEWCRDKAKSGIKVFISEYNAPKDFECVWEMEMKQRVNNNSNTLNTTEKLFVYRG